MELLPGGDRFVTASESSIALWHTRSGAPLFRMEGHGDLVRSIAIGERGQQLLSASRDGTVRLWALRASGALDVLSCAPGTALHAMPSAGDERVLAMVAGPHVPSRTWIWKREDATWTDLPGSGEGSQVGRLSPDGRWAVTTGSGCARVWDVDAGELRHELDGERCQTAGGVGADRERRSGVLYHGHHRGRR